MTVGAGFALIGAILSVVSISSRVSREHARAAQAGQVDVLPVSA